MDRDTGFLHLRFLRSSVQEENFLKCRPYYGIILLCTLDNFGDRPGLKIKKLKSSSDSVPLKGQCHEKM